MKSATYSGGLKHLLILGLLLGAVAVGVAEAGKPSSRPLVLTGTGGYTSDVVFKSEDHVLPAVQAASGMTGVDVVSLWRGLEVADDGSIYAIFQAVDTDDTVLPSNGGDVQRQEFTGIVRYDGTDVEVLLATDHAVDLSDGDTVTEATEQARYGEWIVFMDRVSEDGGPLLAGDLVVSRWADRDLTNATAADDVVEIVQLRPGLDAGTFVLEEIEVLHTFTGITSLRGAQVAVDPAGNLYVSITEDTTAGSFDQRLWRLSYNTGTSSYAQPEDMEPPFDINNGFEVDDAGNLYIQGRSHGNNGGTIFQLPAGGDPITDYDAYAYISYPKTCCLEAFQSWTADNGYFVIGLENRGRASENYIGFVSEAQTSDYAERIANTGWQATGAMTADADGAIYVLHADQTLEGSSHYAIDQFVVYRLDLDTSGGGDTGGGDTGGGGGKGGGKGKNK